MALKETMALFRGLLPDGDEALFYPVTKIACVDGLDEKLDELKAIGIASIEQTTTATTDGGVNVITVKTTGGKTYTFQFKNGSKGSTGPKGEPGQTGATGQKGATGAQGPKGTTFTPSVDASGNLSWTNDGGQTNPATVNIKGPKGDTGATGPKGATGDKGATGAAGPKGDTGPTGPKGADAVSKVYTAAVSTSWTGSGPYTQNVAVSGMLATDRPHMDLIPSDTYATALLEMEEYGKIYRIQSYAGGIKLYATEKTTRSLNVQLEVHR